MTPTKALPVAGIAVIVAAILVFVLILVALGLAVGLGIWACTYRERRQRRSRRAETRLRRAVHLSERASRDDAAAHGRSEFGPSQIILLPPSGAPAIVMPSPR